MTGYPRLRCRRNVRLVTDRSSGKRGIAFNTAAAYFEAFDGLAKPLMLAPGTLARLIIEDVAIHPEEYRHIIERSLARAEALY